MGKYEKLAGKTAWPFELYYWDYVIGVFLLSIVFMFTLGSMGSTGMSAIENLQQASHAPVTRAIFSGALFDLANILLVVAIDTAGMSVAFPVGIGLALIIGTVASYLQMPKGDPLLLFSGVVLVLFAMIMSALAYSKLSGASRQGRMKGFGLQRNCRLPDGLFLPAAPKLNLPTLQRKSDRARLSTPYTALFLFSIGLVASNVIVNTIFMKAGGKTYGQYFAGTMEASFRGRAGRRYLDARPKPQYPSSGVAGPAISYALGQGATW